MNRTFDVADLLTVTTGRLLCSVDRLYDLLGYMVRDSVWTHQLPRVGDECKPWLLRWFPELQPACDRLDSLDRWIAKTPDQPDRGIVMWLSELWTTYPTIRAQYDVPQIPQDDHTRRNPV